MAGTKDVLRWLVSYLNFSIAALANFMFGSWVPSLGWRWQPYLESNYPRLWLWLLAEIYMLREGKATAVSRWQIPRSLDADLSRNL